MTMTEPVALDKIQVMEAIGGIRLTGGTECGHQIMAVYAQIRRGEFDIPAPTSTSVILPEPVAVPGPFVVTMCDADDEHASADGVRETLATPGRTTAITTPRVLDMFDDRDTIVLIPITVGDIDILRHAIDQRRHTPTYGPVTDEWLMHMLDILPRHTDGKYTIPAVDMSTVSTADLIEALRGRDEIESADIPQWDWYDCIHYESCRGGGGHSVSRSGAFGGPLCSPTTILVFKDRSRQLSGVAAWGPSP